MRTYLTALMLGTMAVAAAAPTLAADTDAHRIGERLRDRVSNEGDRRDDRRDARDERRDDRAERRDDRRDDRYDRRDDRRDDRYNRRDDRRDDYRNGYAYRSYGAANWNRQWTPYGFGYNDRFTRDWVLRNFADRNRNGRISDSEWRRAQDAFYRLADRNRDGYITRFEYDWALRALQSNMSYGYYRR
jgi:hypothetical protein